MCSVFVYDLLGVVVVSCFLFFFFYFFFFSSRRRHTRSGRVTGVQTCALPIYYIVLERCSHPMLITFDEVDSLTKLPNWTDGLFLYIRECVNKKNGLEAEIGRASCRERV